MVGNGVGGGVRRRGAPDPPAGGDPAAGRRAQLGLAAAAVVALGIGTFAAHTLAEDAARDEAVEVAEARLGATAASLETVVGRSVGGLRGAAALADDDAARGVDEVAFRAFAEGIVGDEVDGIALGIVEADGRAPIVAVVSPDASYQQVVGFDYASEPARAAALALARDDGRAVLSAPVPLQPDDRPGFAVVAPIYAEGEPATSVVQRRAAFVGFVTVRTPAADVLAALRRELPPGTGVSVSDADTLLFESGLDDADGVVREQVVSVPGRTWHLTVVPAEGPSMTLSNAVLAGGVASILGLLVFLVVSSRYQRRLLRAYEAQRQSQQRSATLEALASRLARSISSAEVGQALLAQLRPFTGAAWGVVLVAADDSDGRLDLLAAHGYDAATLVPQASVDLAASPILAGVVESAEPAWLPSPLAWRDDPVTSGFAGPGMAVAAVPFVADDTRPAGGVLGVLVLVHERVRSFEPDERTLLTTVAALAARALDRARRYDVEHDAAVVLQRALLPDRLASVPDVSVCVRYLPATGGFAVGGDWYDLFPLGDGRIGVVVGDVVGRGVKAAATMGRLRSAIRALTELVPEPAVLLRAVEHHAPTIPDALCATLVYAVVDPAAGRISYVRAGHPPPLLLRANGPAELLEGALSPPLGVSGSDPVNAVTVSIETGDTLVLYTDGFVERRGEPITDGLERLRTIGTAAALLETEGCCDHMVEQLLGAGGHGDDAALVAVRLEPVSPPDTPASPEPASEVAPFA